MCGSAGPSPASPAQGQVIREEGQLPQEEAQAAARRAFCEGKSEEQNRLGKLLKHVSEKA